VSALTIGLIVFALVYGSALLAMLVHSRLPEEHLSSESKDVVKLGIALIATMSALVLSLLISSAKAAFDTRSNQLVQASADIMMLDRVLARYGPETKDARSFVQQMVVVTLNRFWPAEGSGSVAPDAGIFPVEALFDKIEPLSPQNDAQRSLRSRALSLALDIGRTRLLLFERSNPSIPVPFLVVQVFWVCIIFASFGLFAPRNTTVIAALGVCALSVAAAVFLILELDRSFEGMLKVSDAPLRAALAQLGR
jgi:hypothetical protein